MDSTKSLEDVKAKVFSLWKPPPILTVSEWAQAERVLSPEASAEPGKWYNERAQHLVAPMDSLGPHDPCQEVALKFSSQSGKTEVILNFIGYIMAHDPGPALAIQPNQKPMGEAFSKDRISPMLRDTPALHGKVAATKSRDSENTIYHKKFAGGHLTIGGANSPAGLASRPIRYLLADEIDRWEGTKEGHALPLARKRTRTFFNRKILKVSSPTYDNVGIDSEYQSSELQYELHITCPACGESQMPAFNHFTFKKKDLGKATYTCQHCGIAHSFKDENKLKGSAFWKCVKDEGWRTKGYWMNQWASPFATWTETIEEFLDAKEDPEKLKVVVNTAFCEGWVEPGEEINESSLSSRRESYSEKSLPDQIYALVAAVDVQDDRFELEIIGYGIHEESWGVERRVIRGDPGQSQIWEDLDAALNKTYVGDDGRFLNVLITLIDSGGHYTQQVYDFCSTRQSRRVYPIRGVGGEGKPLASPVKKKIIRRQRMINLFNIGVDDAKALVHARLKISEPGPGYCHFPMSYDDEYFSQLAAEKRVTKFVKGFARREWIKTRARNEALDIRVYAIAAIKILDPTYSTRIVRSDLQKSSVKQEVAESSRAPFRPRGA